MRIRRTIVRFDFVGSKKLTDTLNNFAGTDGIRGYTDKLKDLWIKALSVVIPNYQLDDILLREEGDGAYLIFDNADNAHNFALNLLSNQETWPFRIGAATGEIDRAKGKQPVGQPIADAQRLEKYGAEPGGFCIDEATYNALSLELQNEQNYIQTIVKGENPGEQEIPAWYYQIISKHSFNLPQNNITLEKCVTILRLLDYEPHEGYFKKLITLREVAFLIQASNERVQNWLIERLVYQIPNSIRAKKYLIDFKKYVLGEGVENFWYEFKDISKDTNFNLESIIDDLANLCQKRTVIIIMRKLNYLDEGTVKKILLFWDALVKKIRLIQNRELQSRFVLLLVVEPTQYKSKFCIPEQKFNFTKPNQSTIKKILKKPTQDKEIFLLSSLDKISSINVQEWLQKTEVLSFLKEHDQNNIDKLLNDVIPHWGTVPENILNYICEDIFFLKKGIAEIEDKWSVLK